MIILDTHVWLWWAHGDGRLPSQHVSYIQANEKHGLGISAISCWEVAMLVARGKVIPSDPLEIWLPEALSSPTVQLLPLSPEVAIEATRLPGTFHRDPADQIIVATARISGYPLVTLDRKILAYPHVRTAP